VSLGIKSGPARNKSYLASFLGLGARFIHSPHTRGVYYRAGIVHPRFSGCDIPRKQAALQNIRHYWLLVTPDVVVSIDYPQPFLKMEAKEYRESGKGGLLHSIELNIKSPSPVCQSYSDSLPRHRQFEKHQRIQKVKQALSRKQITLVDHQHCGDEIELCGNTERPLIGG